MSCECKTWARVGGDLLWLSHHPNCDRYKPEPEVRRLLLRLIEGIEEWANDEDGVHPMCWDAYREACCVLGMPNRLSNVEEV